MVSTQLKKISQIGSFPQVGVKIKIVRNHHLEHLVKVPRLPFQSLAIISWVPISLLKKGWLVARINPTHFANKNSASQIETNFPRSQNYLNKHIVQNHQLLYSHRSIDFAHMGPWEDGPPNFPFHPHNSKEIPSYTVGETSGGPPSRGMWVRS